MSNARSYYAIIPSHVRYCKEIEANAKLLYGELTALAHHEGYCWASNSYFAELYGVDVSTIKRWLSSLRDQKFIVIETERQGIQSQRKIWISTEIQKMFTKAQNCAPPSSKMSPPQLKNEPHNITYTNTEEEEREGAMPPDPQPPPKIFIQKRIRMDQTRYDSLISDFGKEKIDQMIDRLDEYADINPRRFKQYACHAAVIRNWIRGDDSKKYTNTFKGKELRAEENMKIGMKIAEMFPEKIKNNEIYISKENVQFTVRRDKQVFNYNVSYADFGFKDQLGKCLKVLNLPADFL